MAPNSSDRDRARTTITGLERDLIALSHRVHAHPELKFEEEKSSAWVAGMLSDHGLDVEFGICDLPTAFAARIGSGPLHLSICAEYDALPAVGHACGHNIIAAAAVGAGLALAPLVDELGITLSILGTPAEEGGGGKVLMLERGGFDGIHASLMVHPAPIDGLRPRVSAVSHFRVKYTGKESHAAAAPQLGVNAADAFVVAQTAIGLLRQHLRATDQVHGFVTKGGDAANIIPAHTEGDWMVRSSTIAEVHQVVPRVEACFHAGALATGAHVDFEAECPIYSHMEHHSGLVDLYREATVDLGRTYDDSVEMTFSTDMGNVSLAMPSIHPTIGIETGGAVNHQPEFAAACINSSADNAILHGSLGMALTAIAAATGPLRDELIKR